MESLGSRPETEFERLARFLRLANGFALAFVRANVPVVRERVAADLSKALGTGAHPVAVRVLRLGGSNTDLLDEIDALKPPIEKGEALFVFGLESSIPGDLEQEATILERLNRQREGLRELPGPIVFFLPEYALTRLAREAADLWAWRSGVFELQVLEEEVTFILNATRPSNSFDYENLTKQEKQSYLDTLQGVLDDIESSHLSPRVIDRAVLHHQLGYLRLLVGEWQKAEEHLEAAMRLFKEAGSIDGEANVLRSWGLLLQELGRYDESQEKSSRARQLYQEIGDRLGVAATTYQLGNVATSENRLDEAIEDYQSALDLFEDLGDRAELGNVHYNLAVALRLQNHLEAAEQHLRQAHDIAKDLGDVHGYGLTLDQLGRIARQRGQGEEALDLFRRALSISRELGDRYEEAFALLELGGLLEQRGDLEEAWKAYQRSFEIAEDLGERWIVGDSISSMAILAAKRGDLEGAMLCTIGALGAHASQPPHRLEHTFNKLARVRELVDFKEFDDRVREQLPEETASAFLKALSKLSAQQAQRS